MKYANLFLLIIMCPLALQGAAAGGSGGGKRRPELDIEELAGGKRPRKDLRGFTAQQLIQAKLQGDITAAEFKKAANNFLLRNYIEPNIYDVRALLNEGADPDAAHESYQGMGPNLLMNAIRWGSMDLVDTLIAAGADKDAITANGDTALIYAVRYKGGDWFKFLLQRGFRKGLDEAVEIARAGNKHAIIAAYDEFVKEAGAASAGGAAAG